MRNGAAIKPFLILRQSIRIHVSFLQGFIGKFMGQFMFANDYFSLDLIIMRITQHLNDAAFGIPLPGFKISDLNDNRVSVPGTA
jgi:hypothetical protein